MAINTVNSLWVGTELPLLERLSMASFLIAGHDFNLYVYQPVEGVPDGVRQTNANMILPLSEYVEYGNGNDQGSPALFANLFRFTYLYERGGCWVDADQVCLRPFEFTAPYVFSSEHHPRFPSGHPNLAVTIVPARSSVMGECIESVRAELQAATWGLGPRVIRAAIEMHGLTNAVVSPETFCPLPWQRALEAANEYSFDDIPTRSYGIHLWSQVFRRSGRELHENDLHPGSLLHELQQRLVQLL